MKKNNKDNLGTRMKKYESVSKTYLTESMPLIIRVDGKSFSTLTKKLDKPFDEKFKMCMIDTAEFLVKNIMGAKMAYIQSDEISILITDYDTISTQSWFDKNLQKIVSVSASMATMKFNQSYYKYIPESMRIKDYGLFDSRAFVLPKEEVTNYFIFRQNDTTRNSIQGLGQSLFSHKQLQYKSCDEIQDMLKLKKNINWNDTPVYFKRGGCVYRDRTMKIESFQDKIDRCSKKKNCDKILQNLKDTKQLDDKLLKELDCFNCKEIRKNNEVVPSNKIIIDEDIPIFTSDRDFIEQFINLDIHYATNRKVRNDASLLLEKCHESKSVEEIHEGITKLFEDRRKNISVNDDTEEKLFEHEMFDKHQSNICDIVLQGYKDDVISIRDGSVVVCHLMTQNKMTAPLKVKFSGEYLCWIFGNHTLQMLKELDNDIRFSLIKK